MFISVIKVSYSKASCYNRCPKMHHLRYIKKLEPKKKSRPLTFGSDFHSLLEVRKDKKLVIAKFKEIKEIFNDLKDSDQETLGYNYPNDLKTVFLDYQKTWKGTEMPEDTEVDFEIPIMNMRGTEVVFKGIIDEVYSGGKSIGEHKTFSRKPDIAFLAMNTQVSLYSRAVEYLYGYLPETIKWDYIKSVPSKYPAWLEKSKRFSAAASQDITPYSWLRACKERGIEDEAILAKADDYAGNISNFFFRCSMGIEPYMVKQIFQDFKKTAQDIVNRGEKDQRAVITRDCTWCDYFNICYGQATGADVDYIIEKDYQLKVQEEDEKVVEAD